MPNPSQPREPDIAALRLRLARLRQQRGWSYSDLAAESGVGRNTLVILENGKARPGRGDLPESNGSLLTWYRIAEAFDMSIGELLAPMQPHRNADRQS